MMEGDDPVPGGASPPEASLDSILTLSQCTVMVTRAVIATAIFFAAARAILALIVR